MEAITPDRISVTYGRTIQVSQYEPATVSFTYASDVKKGESIQKAIMRVSDIVEEKLSEEVSALNKLKRKRKEV
jgi:hypothetical protein